MIKKIIIIFIIFNVLKSISQNKEYKSIKNSNLTTNEKISKIDSLLVFSVGYHRDSIYLIKKKYAFWLYKSKKIDKAINEIEDALNIVSTDKNSSEIQTCYYYLGYFNKKNNSLSKSVINFDNALKVDDKNRIAGNTYYQLGLLYNDFYDDIHAIYNFKVAIPILKKNNDLIKVRNAYFYLSNILLMDNHIFEGLFYAKKADSLTDIIPTPNKTRFKIKTKLADFYNTTKNLKINTALKFYYKALEIAKIEKDINQINETYINIGNLFNTTNYKKSLFYLNKISKEDCENKQLYNVYLNYALTYQYGKQYDKSILYFKKAVFYLSNLNSATLKDVNISILNKVKYKKSLLHILPLFACTYLNQFEDMNKLNSLIKSLDLFKLSDYLIDLVKINSNEFKSKLFWREKSANIYGKAIKVCFLNNNIKDAFYFMEKNKSLLLTEDIATKNYRLTLNVPKKSLEKETQYKKELVSLENFITNKTTKDSILKVKIDLERTLTSFQDSIFKGKKRLEKELKIVSIKEVQKNIKENEVFIEYHISKDDGYGIYTNNENGYVVFLTKNESYFFEINQMTDFRKTLKTFIKNLKVPLETKEGVEEFNKNSCAIYNKLFPTNKIKELIKNKKLTIVPDGILSFLPFETLITKQNTSEYLIFTSEISYAFSGSFQHENKKMHRKPKKEFLGIAPIQFNYDSLTNLPKTKQEMLTIKKLFSSNHYFTETATKQNFEKISNDYNIIHLATHADASDEASPWIAFKNEKLLLDDLYTTKTQADLVVLSACNTSLGKIEIGEGVMSLVRGFFYSGTNSVVSSLWNVNDKVSSNIMIDFYKNLKKGNTKSKALHNAKLKYLKNHSLTEASPYYWSSFILIGDAGELASIDSNLNYFYYFVGVLILFFLVFIVRKVTIMK